MNATIADAGDAAGAAAIGASGAAPAQAFLVFVKVVLLCEAAACAGCILATLLQQHRDAMGPDEAQASSSHSSESPPRLASPTQQQVTAAVRHACSLKHSTAQQQISKTHSRCTSALAAAMGSSCSSSPVSLRGDASADARPSSDVTLMSRSNRNPDRTPAHAGPRCHTSAPARSRG